MNNNTEVSNMFDGVSLPASLQHFAYGMLALVFVILALSVAIQMVRKIKRERLIAKSGIKDIDKMDGFQFEEYLKVLFKKLGYKTAVTKKSGDFGVDVLLQSDTGRIAVQAKRYGYGNKVSLKAVQEVYAGGTYYLADERWVVTNAFFTKPAMELAKACNVRLVNRNELQELILKLKPEKTAKEIRSEVNPEQKTCPKCKSKLVLRTGKNNEFYGCSNYPKCTYTASIYEVI
jgi:restriction system protein